MKRRAFLQVASALSLGALAGCGGGGKSPNSSVAGRGRVQMTLRWPDTSTTRLIPTAAQSISVQLLQGSTLINRQVLVRSTGAIASATFDNLPVGEYTLKATAYPTTSGSGVGQAVGSSTVTVSDGVTANVRVTMASTVASLDLVASALAIGETVPLSVSAKNATGEIVLVASSVLTWSSSDPTIIAVDANGIASAKAVGRATITVKDGESGVSTSVVVVVRPAQPHPVPQFLGGPTHTGLSTVSTTATGAVKWTFPTGAFIWASPVISRDNTVYISSYDGSIYAIDGLTGTQKWATALGPDLVRSTAALTNDGDIVVGNGTSLYLLNRVTGEKLWTYAAGRGVASSPVIDDGGTVYVGTGERGDDVGSLVAVDLVTGTKKWETMLVGGAESSPALAPNGTLYIGTASNNVGGSVYAIDSASGAIKWTNPTGDYHQSSPSIATDGTVYIGGEDLTNGGLYALNGATGTQKWKFANGGVTGSAAIGSDGSVYFTSRDGNIYALSASGTVKWSVSTADECVSSPTLSANGTLYAGSLSGRLTAINTATGVLSWIFNASDSIASSVAIGSDGTIYFGSYDGSVYALS